MVRLPTWAAAALAMASVGGASVASEQLAANSATLSPPTTTSVNPVCTQTAIDIPNAGFERGSLKPWSSHVYMLPTPSYSGSIAVVSGGYKSKYALELSVGYSAYITQKLLPTCEVTAYTVSFAHLVLNSTSAKHCRVYGMASRSKFNRFSGSFPLIEGSGWTTNAFEYYSHIETGVHLEIGISCSKNNTATILLDDIKLTSAGSIAGQGCPKDVHLTNGGFDTGKIAPWVPSNFTKENGPKHRIVSPGYKSAYAFEMEFAAANLTDWYFGLDFDNLCEGSYYNVSWAINWLNYTGPLAEPAGQCTVSVLPLGCEPLAGNRYSTLATTTPGWVQHSYVCQSYQNGKNNLDVEVSCLSADGIPAFALQMDSFNVQLLSSPPARSLLPAREPAPREVVTEPLGV